MERLKNEKGYSLLLTLMLILLFSILGASLMAMTFNGVAKNETREHITQAQDLATKGLEKIEKQFQSDLKNFSKTFPNLDINKGLTNSEFEKHFNNIIDSYDCHKNKLNPSGEQSETGEFFTCIHEVKDLSDGSESKTKKELIFKSTGKKGKHEFVVYETLELGADDIQKVLNYTISALKNNDDGGNIFFHGGSEVTGDLNIEGSIFSTNHGFATGSWAESVFPHLINSKVNIGNTAYNFEKPPLVNRDSSKQYSEHIKGKFENIYNEVTNLSLNANKIFDSRSSYKITNNAEVIKPVNIQSELDKFSQINLPTNNDKLTGTKIINQVTKYNKGLSIEGNDTDIEFIKNVYVNGNLNIGNTINNSSYQNISIEGKTIYVNGNVNIRRTNLEASFTLFATGEVNITYTTISGIKEGKLERGSMIIFSDGDLKLSNLSDFSNSPNIINGFFYSSQTIELYGFISNTEIIGGVAGNNIVLNSLRGKSKGNLSSWDIVGQDCYWFIVRICNDIYRPYQVINGNYYETRPNQSDFSKFPSRLKIKYNDELLDTYRNSIDFTSTVIFPDNVLAPVKKGRSYDAP